MIKYFLYKLKYKKASANLEMLIGILENKSEKRAALGNEFLDYEEDDLKFTKKMNRLYAECERLEKLLNLQ